jgi:MFS family permease
MMIAWGGLSACMLFVNSPASFYVLRFFTGVAEAGFFPAWCCTLHWFPTQKRGQVMALFMSAIPISGLIGGPLSGWMLSHFRPARPAWRLAVAIPAARPADRAAGRGCLLLPQRRHRASPVAEQRREGRDAGRAGQRRAAARRRQQCRPVLQRGAAQRQRVDAGRDLLLHPDGRVRD